MLFISMVRSLCGDFWFNLNKELNEKNWDFNFFFYDIIDIIINIAVIFVLIDFENIHQIFFIKSYNMLFSDWIHPQNCYN